MTCGIYEIEQFREKHMKEEEEQGIRDDEEDKSSAEESDQVN